MHWTFGDRLEQACRPSRSRRWRFGAPASLLAVLAGCAASFESAFCAAEAGLPKPVSFRNEVMAVLARAGCSAGTCHGNKNGKGGFKLSLRGQDPDLDYAALTHDLFARRVNLLEPEQSLILLKPATQVAHEGGLRFKRNSAEYEILRHWIADGMGNDLATAPKLERIEVIPPDALVMAPAHELQLQVWAKFSDGTTRDVTFLAVYEPANGLAKVSPAGKVQQSGPGETTVLARYLHCQEAARLAFVPDRPGFKWNDAPANNYVDEHIFAKLRRLRLNASGLCPDEVFVRRAYLDLLGILPTAEEARAFVNPPAGGSQGGRAPASTSGSRNSKSEIHVARSTAVAAEREVFAKRSRLIDRLLERPEFADFWALKWADLLRVEAHSLDSKGVQNFHHWIRQSIAENKPLDRFVRELITARGSTYSNPAANYYRPNRDPATRGRAAAQVFLGTRLQCAECHNHPSDRWTQDDYYDWAALFARVGYKVVENKREIGSDEHEWNGEQIVFVAREGSYRNLRTGRDARPRFLGEAPTTGRAGFHPGPEQKSPGRHGSRPSQDANSGGPADLDDLAAWLTSPRNTLFASVQANRIWHHLLGRGLVDPPDDFRATNPASHPELLDALARDFVKHQFDARHVIRLIMNSRTYQLAAEPNDPGQEDESSFSHALVRRLGAEQMLDGRSQVTGVPPKFAGYPAGLRAAELPGVRPESKGKRRANAWDQFLEIFGKPPRLLTTDTERSCECSMGQAFQMISGPTLTPGVTAPAIPGVESRVSRWLADGKSDREILETLYWTALTRAPTREEFDVLLTGLEAARDRRAEWEDILWGLLNSKDFVFRK